MNGTLKNLALTTILLSISVSAYSANAEGRCADIKSRATSGDKASPEVIADLLNDQDPEAQSCAILAAREGNNVQAAEALLANVENYQTELASKGPYEENLKSRLKAINSIWALGEIGNPQVMQKLLKLYKTSDDIVKINMAIGAGKTKGRSAENFLFSVAGNASESNVVRAAAYEMLEANKGKLPSPQLSAASGMEKGDLIFTGGIFGVPQPIIGDLPIGHAGIYAGTEVKDGKVVVVIYDCVPDSFKPYGGVRKIFSFTNFTHQNRYAFYGNRVSKVRPTAAQRDLIIKFADAKVGKHYSDSHFSQQGPEEFDCVGYTEYAYEAAGLNPTPEDQETGWGWPLTPAEQFAATTANARPASQIIVPSSALIVPQQGIIVPNQAIITQGGAALMNSFGMKAQELPEVTTPVQFEAVN